MILKRATSSQDVETALSSLSLFKEGRLMQLPLKSTNKWQYFSSTINKTPLRTGKVKQQWCNCSLVTSYLNKDSRSERVQPLLTLSKSWTLSQVMLSLSWTNLTSTNCPWSRRLVSSSSTLSSTSFQLNKHSSMPTSFLDTWSLISLSSKCIQLLQLKSSCSRKIQQQNSPSLQKTQLR